ncbi:MAG: hypothetical protein ABIS50_05630 [Luteolibacter sp.]|uniref:hypothetical protein n=1 Tax=Luteolibacter sp. TaxID=1962973 RepID=UPI003266BFAB
MNSDPHESAAWRTFGMLDADEAAGFDETMRHDPELRDAYREMDCLATAIAVTATVPVAPRAGQLERLHARLGLNASKRTNWFGISGWAAAAALAMILILDRHPARVTTVAEIQRGDSVPAVSVEKHTMAAESNPTEENDSDVARKTDPQQDMAQVTGSEVDGKAVAKVETKRLIQEIEVLRDKLENFQERDRKRFEAVDGMAWPIVMRMVPPGTNGEITGNPLLSTEEPPITAMLGDALTASNMAVPNYAQNVTRGGELAKPKVDPSAIPIYDAARDTGTLVVNNLPAKTASESYNLWVRTEEGGNPVYVGRLPESSNLQTESFDFSLGSTAIVPSGFVLTKDTGSEPVTPSVDNTILQGPH